jgi:chromosome segregation ATPase
MTQRWHTAEEVADLHNQIRQLNARIALHEDEESRLRTENKLLMTRNTFLATQIAELNRQLTAATKQVGYISHG